MSKIGFSVYLDKRRLVSYAVVAFVIGSVLGVSMWDYGGVYMPKPPLPATSTFGSLRRFSSYEDLKNFLSTHMVEHAVRLKGRGFGSIVSRLSGSISVLSADSAKGDAGELEISLGFSGTNIQVEGVDEADLVKTDGEYIYLASEKSVIIVRAYPPEEAEVVSRLKLTQNIGDLFVNCDKLVLFLPAERYWYPDIPLREEPSTTIQIYDISDRASPTLDRNVTVDGYYFNSRMIGDYVYAIISQPAYLNNSEVDLPTIRSNEFNIPTIRSNMCIVDVEPTDIYYANQSDSFYTFTNIVAINVQNPVKAVSHETFLLGDASNLYVSQNNIYITSPSTWEDENQTLDGTMVYKIGVIDGEISYMADGFVPGWVLNQFSMDEQDGYFRIATTNGHVSRRGSSSTSSIYVLNEDMEIVGSLEGLAPGEQIYSARFMGSRCYLVTFRKVDPLFVVDLSDPERPKVLGKLKIPGYSDYLHPYDDTHIIGVGKETVAAEEGDFSWYQGVKISLFDVSDVSEPRELAKVIIGDRGTDSPVLRDHKAFLFSRSRHLLVLPVLVAEIDPNAYSGGVPPNAEGEYVFQGAYVFDVSLTGGFRLRGMITHLDGDDALLKSGFYFESEYSVERSLYIDDVLYTISNGMIKMNSLEDLEEINRVELLGAAQ